MDILNTIITGMTKEQVRFFKLYKSRSHLHDDRLDLRLFDYMRKSGEKYDEQRIVQSLYGKTDKNSFYRLRNRLLQDLNKSMLVQHFGDDEANHALHLLALERFYFSRNQVKIAHFYLKKAEAQAQKIENHELLDLIYGEFLRLSHENLSINPEKYIRKRKENQENIRQLREIDDILAAVSYKMKATQNFSTDTNPVMKVLQKTVAQYSSDKVLLRSPKFRFKIYHAVTQILLQKRDYVSLENYLAGTYAEFEKESLFNKANHDTRLQMLVYLINSLFKNNRIKESLKYTSRLHALMKEHQRQFYDKYLFFYYNSLVINYSRIDRSRAIEILNEMKTIPSITGVPFHEMFVYLNLAVCFFDKKDFHQSVRNLNKLYTLPGYSTADRSLQFKINVAELLIRYELNAFDVLEIKIRQIRKDFREFFSRTVNARDVLMVDVISRLMNHDNLKKQKDLMLRLKKHILNDSAGHDDAEILSYRPWLSEKIYS